MNTKDISFDIYSNCSVYLCVCMLWGKRKNLNILKGSKYIQITWKSAGNGMNSWMSHVLCVVLIMKYDFGIYILKCIKKLSPFFVIPKINSSREDLAIRKVLFFYSQGFLFLGGFSNTLGYLEGRLGSWA